MKTRKLPMHLQFFAEPEAGNENPAEPVETPSAEEKTPEQPIETPTPEKEPEKAPEKETPAPEPEEKKEPVKEEPKVDDKELEELKAKLAEAEKFKTQYEQAQKSLQGYETSLAKIVEQKIEAIPESFRELIPEGSTQDKLDWLTKAEKSGLFSVKEEKSIGQSTKVNDHESNRVELKDMTSNQKLIAGIKDFYSKK